MSKVGRNAYGIITEKNSAVERERNYVACASSPWRVYDKRGGKTKAI